MVNTPSDNGGFDPSAIYPIDAIYGNVDSSALADSSLTQDNQQFNNPQQSGGGGFLGSVSGDLTNLIPGAKSIAALIHIVENLVGDIDTLVLDVESTHPLNAVAHFLGYAGKLPELINFIVTATWQEMTDLTVGSLFRSMLFFGLGVDPNKFSNDGEKAVTTVDTMMGFAMILPVICAGINMGGKALFANRWSESLKDTVAKIPTEFGLSWALGLVLNQAFSDSLGNVLTEEINLQKSPRRIEWQQLRVLLRQHVINQDQFDLLLQKAGFPDEPGNEQRTWLDALIDVPIPIGDIQQLYYRGTIDGATAQQLIAELGFNDKQVKQLYDLYVDKAENQASTELRNIARQMFANHLMAEGQYRTILTQSNYPSKLIDDDIAAITLEQTIGKVLHSVAVIKSRRQHNEINDTQAIQELGELNYSAEYITELLQAWGNAPIRAKHGLSQAKILSYMLAGLIQPKDAYNQLVAGGLEPNDATFLVAHPTASGGTKIHARSPGLVIQAYIDGAVNNSQLSGALTAAGVQSGDLDYYIAIAHHRIATKHQAADGSVEPSAADWRAAFKKGIIDFPTLVSSLQTLHYAPDAAMLIAEIENGGPYQAPQPGPFSSLAGAEAYLESKGYTINPPPDPKLLAAEQLLAASGYSWTAPNSVIVAPQPVQPPGGLR